MFIRISTKHLLYGKIKEKNINQAMKKIGNNEV